jgi:8-oxo-dGTP pyrophosphatase MutT (NUDIX family)
LAKLAAFVPRNDSERVVVERLVAFVEADPRCFERTLLAGHVTGSAWIVDPARERVLLTHHRKLGMWLQLGGHADGDPDVAAVALREAREESGLSSVRLVTDRIFDVDVHAIPAHGVEPEHFHYDVRFLFEADPAEPLTVSAESHDLAWVPVNDVADLATDASVLRMLAKT